MDLQSEKMIDINDTVCDAYDLMEQITNLLSVVMENYFILNIDTDKRRREWGRYSYKAVKALVEAVFDCSAKAYEDLYHIKQKLKED